MAHSWIFVGAMVVNSILAIVFILGGFFMTRSYYRKYKKSKTEISQ